MIDGIINFNLKSKIVNHLPYFLVGENTNKGEIIKQINCHRLQPVDTEKKQIGFSQKIK
jgi:hypothetical protein